MQNTFTLAAMKYQWRHDSRKTEQSITIHSNASHYSYPIVPWIWTDQRHLWQWDTCGELRQLASADRPPTKPRAPSLSLARSPSLYETTLLPFFALQQTYGICRITRTKLTFNSFPSARPVQTLIRSKHATVARFGMWKSRQTAAMAMTIL